MGVVNGTDAVNYIRAENNGDIVLEARGGSIGEPVYETDKDGNVLVDSNNKPIIYRDKNNGIRILNSVAASSSANDTNVSNVILRAQDNVYVTGVASTDGKTAVAQGPAGTLNLTVDAGVAVLLAHEFGEVVADGSISDENTREIRSGTKVATHRFLGCCPFLIFNRIDIGTRFASLHAHGYMGTTAEDFAAGCGEWGKKFNIHN